MPHVNIGPTVGPHLWPSSMRPTSLPSHGAPCHRKMSAWQWHNTHYSLPTTVPLPHACRPLVPRHLPAVHATMVHAVQATTTVPPPPLPLCCHTHHHLCATTSITSVL